jgi:hypothetical protein
MDNVHRIPRLCWQGTVTVIPEIVLVDMFMVLLLLKLDATPQIPWTVVAAPLWTLLAMGGKHARSLVYTCP